ncbi:MAG: O-antigen ligase family protein [Opitutales bacterium]
MVSRSKPKISLREQAVALTGALTLAYTAWGFGGVIAWSLHVMLAGGLATFALAVLPLPQRVSQASGLSPQLASFLRTPALYFAAAFLLYLAIAAWNPAWQIASDERGWWLESVTPPLAVWLPTSVAAPYEPMNAWRIFNMHLAAFSLAFGFYFGLSSRRSAQCVLWFFLINVALMAAVAIAQKYTGAEEVLWSLPSENPQFWGSFFYRNQGAAFLNWGIVIAGALYFYHSGRAREQGRSGGPHFLAFCLIGLIAASVGLALSRGGILFAAILVAAFLLLVLLDYLRTAFRSPPALFLPLSLILATLLVLGLYQTYRSIDWQAVEQRFGDIEATIEDADRDARVLSSKLTWFMAKDAIWTGWGAGSFRYAFPMYQQELPELFYQYHHRKKGWMGRKFYRYAHNDILQFLAEYGIVGCSLLLLAIFSFLLSGLRFQLSSLWLLLGLACAMGHAFLDFIFHSPSFWVACIASLALVSRLLLLEARRG